jgi:hypothetical protein
MQELLQFLTAGSNLPFAISGVFMLLLVLLELVGVLTTGVGLSHLGELDQDAVADVGGGGLAATAMAYLHWGKVPFILILMALAGLFSLAGFGLQSIALGIGGGLLPGWLAALPSGVVAVWGTHKAVLPLSRLMPSEQGNAAREDQFVGLPGRITIGPCRWDAPGEALLRDLEGREHYVRVKPAERDLVLPVQTEIAVTGRTGDGAVYLAVPLLDPPDLKSLPIVDDDPALDQSRAASALSNRQERQS